MSYAVLALCGVNAAQPGVAASLLGALSQACNLRQPIGRYAILVSPEIAHLVRRIELVDEWQAMQLHALAGRLSRFSARGDALLIISVDEDVRFQVLPLGPVRRALSIPARKETA